MAFSKLNTLSLFPPQTLLPAPKSSHPQLLPLYPVKNPLNLHLSTKLIAPILLPELPLKTSTIKEESQHFELRENSDSLSVAFPSISFSNTLFFSSAYNTQVIVGDNEPEDKLIGRFRREVLKAGVLQECKRRRFFETSQEKKKRKAREAAKRNRKRRRPPPKTSKQVKEETSKKQAEDFDDDNWELFDVDLPYI